MPVIQMKKGETERPPLLPGNKSSALHLKGRRLPSARSQGLGEIYKNRSSALKKCYVTNLLDKKKA